MLNNISKEEKNREVLKRLIRRLKKYKVTIGLIMFSFLVITIFTFFRPLIIERITDKGMVEKDFQIVLIFSLILLGLSIVEQVAEVLQTRFFVQLQNKLEFSLNEEAFKKLLHLNLEYFSENNNTEIVNRITTDIDQVGMIAGQGVMFVFYFLLSIISGLVGLFVINWKLALLVMSVIPIKYVIAKILSGKIEKVMEQLIENTREFSSWFGDNINGIREIKLWNLYQRRIEIFKNKQIEMIENSTENAMLQAYNRGTDTLTNWMVTCALYIAGSVLVIRNELTIGGVIAFLSYSNYVIGPISSLLNMKMIFAGILPSAKRLFEFLENNEEENGSTDSSVCQTFSKLDFQKVGFSYKDLKVLEDVSFEIKRGDKIAIIGQNGSGKTTIINLLLRFLCQESGTIKVNDMEINKYPINEYRNLFGVVSQETYLFQDTIKNNIDLQKKFQTEKIEHACLQSGISTFVEKLEEGLDSRVGRNGAKLSGGEKQKIAVARAIVKDAPIVIMDEATSNFDPEADEFLYQMIEKEFQEKTIILITHRYANLKGMDRIYRLEEGRLNLVNENF